MTTLLYTGLYEGTTPNPKVQIQGTPGIITFISVEGSIGAGKSTFLKIVKSYVKEHRLDATDASHIDENNPEKDYFLVVDEPVDEWSEPIHKVGDEMLSMLEIFYRNPALMGFSFQCYTFTTRLDRLRKTIGKIVPTTFPRRIHLISERSLRGDKLFLKAVHDTTPLSDNPVRQHELFIYNRFHSTVCDDLLERQDMIIYIPTSPMDCVRRIKMRDRNGECGISDAYLASLDKYHQLMLSEFREEAEGKEVHEMVDFRNHMQSDEIEHSVNSFLLKLRESVKSK